MEQTYLEQLIQEQKENKRVTQTWLECYICQTPPTLEQCKAYFEKKGMKVHRRDYEVVCKKMCKKPD